VDELLVHKKHHKTDKVVMLKACALNKSQIASFDLNQINRFFSTNSIETVENISPLNSQCSVVKTYKN